MDPLSITAGCIGIISTIAKTSSSITHFVRDVRDSRRELGETKQQLTELEMTLNLINDDHNREDGNLAQQMPEGIIGQTKLVLNSCQEILVELDALISKYNLERLRTAFQWARKGKDEILALNKQLEAHSRTLQMSLEFSTLVWSRGAAENIVVLRPESRQVIENTEQLMGDTGEIKVATTQLLEGIDVLKIQAATPAALKDILEEVEKLKILISQQDSSDRSGRQEIMRRYLDTLTDFGESEMGGVSPIHDESPQSAGLTPRLAGIALDRFEDPYDLQDDALKNATISESMNAEPATIPPIQTARPRKYLNPDSPLSIVVIGIAGIGKSTFIDYLLQLSPDGVPPGQVGTETCTNKFNIIYNITIYDTEILASRYELIDLLNGKQCEVPDILTATTAELQPWLDAAKSKYYLSPIDPDAPYVKLRVIDTPEFDYLSGALEHGTSAEPTLDTLRKMLDSRHAWENHLSAKVLAIDYSNVSPTPVIYLERLFHRVSSLKHGLVVMDVHSAIDFRLDYRPVLSWSPITGLGGVHPRGKSLVWLAKALKKMKMKLIPHFFINGELLQSNTFEELLSKNAVIDFILFLLEVATEVPIGRVLDKRS